MGPVLALPIMINGVAIGSFATVGGAVAATAVITAVAVVPGAANAVQQHQRQGGAPVDFSPTAPEVPTPNRVPFPTATPRDGHNDAPSDPPTDNKQPQKPKTKATHPDVTPKVKEQIRAHWGDIEKAAKQHGLDPYIAAGVMTRESNAGISLDKNGEGDKGKAFGVMQVDYKHSGLGEKNVARGDPWSEAHLKQGCAILKEKIQQVAAKHPTWSEEKKLQGGVAAYNKGVSKVTNEAAIDVGTTHNNYGSDTLKRAEALRDDQ